MAGIGGISRYNVNQTTDVCFDPDGGTLWSGAKIDGLVLVAQSPETKRYEVLSQSSTQDGRTHISYSRQWFHESCDLEGSEYVEMTGENIFFERGGRKKVYFSQGSYITNEIRTDDFPLKYTHGFLNVESPSIVNEEPAFKYDGKVLQGMSFDKVSAIFDQNGHGKIELTDHPAFTADPGIGSTEGGITFINRDGFLEASGSVSIKTARLAGLSPNEWTSAQVSFVGLRGHVYGARGQFYALLGWAKGVFLDAEGDEHTFLSNVQMTGCR